MGSYDTTVGTLLVGIFFNTFLYGLVVYQFAAYHATKFNDPPTARYMVLYLFILDTFHSTTLIYAAWDYIVTSHNNPAATAVAYWPFVFTPLAVAPAALVTQVYLGIRIWRLTNNKFIFGLIALLAIPSFMMGVMTSITNWIIPYPALARFKFIGTLWLSMQVTVDMFITVTLVIVLGRSRTGLYRTDTIINRLIRGAIQTGFLASIFAFGDLMTRLLFPHMYLYIMFAMPLGRVYTNTLMDILLCRELLMKEAKLNVAGIQSVEADTAFIAPINSQSVPAFSLTTIQLEV